MDRLDFIIERKFQSSNQQKPGKLGNNINGVTNLDLTGEEELVLSDGYGDALDDSTLSEFDVLETYDVDDLILDTLCEAESNKSNTKSNNTKSNNTKSNKNKSNSPGFGKRVANNIAGKLGHKKSAAANQKYHADKAAKSKNSVSKAYHNYRAGVHGARKRNGLGASVGYGVSGATVSGVKSALSNGKTNSDKNKRMKKLY